ncbi:hypothetical protein [Moraxella sp. ZY200743]|uniref:hypothetical protein n=1 Tax=Moraxella sp. ZY200743 TaxID=2911970 RepID=UPI003D7EC435
MSRAKPHFLKTRNVLFPTKGKFVEHLQTIYHRAKSSKNGLVTTNNDILDLKDFIQDYCDKSEEILSYIDLENCYFVVKKSSDYNTPCLFIIENNTNKEKHFSFRNFGCPPISYINFKRFCIHTIIDFKFNYRIKLSKELGKSYDEYDLWHKKPTTKEIVDEFIAIKDIGDKLDEVISPNGSGFNVPVLNQKYAGLKQEFIDFYQSKVATQLNFELKPRN